MNLNRSSVRRRWIFWTIVLVAFGVRVAGIGRLCFWYDEVVTIRLARTENPAALVRLLKSIDATRAVVHPLLLQPWVKVFGPSETSARAFSVLCGVLTVMMVYRLGRRFFGDETTAKCAAGLAAFSPLLVVYSREARMYAWLVLVTCLAWDALLSLRPSAARLVVYALSLVVLALSHPLGLLMIAALALASALNRSESGLGWGAWAGAHGLAAALILPWAQNYLDHEPESAVGALPLRFLFGFPIGFIGGNFVTLLGFIGLIAYGLTELRSSGDDRSRLTIRCSGATASVLIWLLLPPLMLYVYSRVWHPIFGPARYTLFVAPAYLIAVARGLARLPTAPRLFTCLTASLLSVLLLRTMVFVPDLKANWRDAATYLKRQDAAEIEPLVVLSADPVHNVEVVTARYYVGPTRPIFPDVAPRDGGDLRTWYAVGLRGGQPVSPLPDRVGRAGPTADFRGLRLIPVITQLP
jgi:4-amino-4-deoxy-L-arabinose transferase-like glycosyltransferase